MGFVIGGCAYVWVCVCVGFVMCWCLCVGFVIGSCVYVWVCGFCDV